MPGVARRTWPTHIEEQQKERKKEKRDREENRGKFSESYFGQLYGETENKNVTFRKLSL